MLKGAINKLALPYLALLFPSVLAPSRGDSVNYTPDLEADTSLLLMLHTDEDARCTDASVIMFSAFCISFPPRFSGGGLRVERGDQFGECYTLLHLNVNRYYLEDCRANCAVAAVSMSC